MPALVFARYAVMVAVLAAAGGCSVDSEVSRSLGARCDLSSECDERCLTGPRFPGGLCSESCDRDADCQGGASCLELEGGICLFSCREESDCRFLGEGWLCLAQPERGGEPGREVMVCLADA